MKAKVQSIESFLKTKHDPTWRSGQRCATCTHKQAVAINNELRAFAKAKAAGHAMPWTRFFRDRLREVYRLNVVPTAIMRHVREHMGIS